MAKFDQINRKQNPRIARHIAVIGAGWAGCAAATELASRGATVSLFEAARTLGGRARRVDLHGHALDNGQHILLGAYSASLAIMRKVGIDLDAALLRLPLQMVYPNHIDGMQFIAPKLPAPLHLLLALLRAKGLDKQDKLALARFSTTARWMGWQLNQDCSVTELLERFDQTDRLCQLMWNPLCIAALNTPPERASAQVFLNVLRDSLGAKRAASDMLLPKLDLSALFPEQARQWIEAAGGNVHLGTTVKHITPTAQHGWQLDFTSADTSHQQEFDALIVATNPEQATRLLGGNLREETTRQLSGFGYEAITTCYLQYDTKLQLSRTFFALRDQPERQHWGQFVFDRGQLHPSQAGLLAVVVSASEQAIALGNSALATAIAQQLAQVFQLPQLANPLWHQIISEKRATFSCTPALDRPDNNLGLSNCFIAGDYTKGDYPATLEAAVRSGVAAAKLCLQAKS
ncbi:hydroxysqualene dehydroxylase HpnE [Undibacterium sp. RTI2.1]|uniref:hydroxysqualene dehydroxylase HpnE n=1 Tax=unclassified Undibacterium TaxID=2630295 RepID=UPI002B2331D8|nr:MULTISPECIES: hydroxysqualene dehydroxylase HpnE [unclassified Undibacterium]MEB0031751.1 hydroxysqualene dehydroxylase HpnE [Undibacterium sp. RTI2.1]MEB0117780.1 hydroxysqualene dehydroxylase HpnE [Undibacterium sp. RTI2.2]